MEPVASFPLTQAYLADATGLSKVHVNRTLQELRVAGLIVLKGKMLVVPSLDRLMNTGLFNSNYLHMEYEGRQLDSNERSRALHACAACSFAARNVPPIWNANNMGYFTQ